MGEETLKRNLDRALAPPADFPDPRLLSRTMAAVAGAVAHRETARRPARLGLPRMAAQWAAVALVLVLAGSAAAVFLALHRSTTPVTPTGLPVIFPTKMVSPSTGWAVTEQGSSQQVWRTTDGGITWKDVTPKRGAGQSGYYYFLDESHAWLTGEVSGAPSGAQLVTFVTVDGGKTWERGTPISAKLGTNGGSLPGALTLYFLNAGTGWLVISNVDPAHAAWPQVYSTTDGGRHWLLAASEAGIGNSPAGFLPGFAEPSFVSTSTGWLTVGLYSTNGHGAYFSRTLVLVTHDGGHTWYGQPLPIDVPYGAVMDAPQFFGQRQGVMVMHAIDPASPVPAMLLATSDGGLTWTAKRLDWPYIWSIQFVDRNHAWAMAGPGSDFAKQLGTPTISLPLYRSDDGGVTWTRVTTTLNLQAGRSRLTDVHFVDQQTAFATIWNDTGPIQLLRSDDGGRDWTVVELCRSGLGLAYPPPVCPA